MWKPRDATVDLCIVKWQQGKPKDFVYNFVKVFDKAVSQ